MKEFCLGDKIYAASFYKKEDVKQAVKMLKRTIFVKWDAGVYYERVCGIIDKIFGKGLCE